jgi:hypothetical protein
MEMSNWVKLMISHFATDSEFPTWRFIDSCWVYILLAECGQPAETHRTARKIKQAMYCYIWLPPIQTIQTIPIIPKETAKEDPQVAKKNL